MHGAQAPHRALCAGRPSNPARRAVTAEDAPPGQKRMYLIWSDLPNSWQIWSDYARIMPTSGRLDLCPRALSRQLLEALRDAGAGLRQAHGARGHGVHRPEHVVGLVAVQLANLDGDDLALSVGEH